MPNSTDHIFILSSSSANMPALSVRMLLTLPRISLSVSSDRIGLSWALFAERMVERKSRSISFSPFTYLEVAEERERERERGRNGNRKRGEKNWIAGTCALVVKQTGHSLVLWFTISPVDWFTSLHSILSMVTCLVFSLQHF